MQSKTGSFILGWVLGFVLFSSAVFAETSSQNSAYQKYEQALRASVQWELEEQETYGFLSKLHRAGTLLTEQQFDEAEEILQDLLLQMELVKNASPHKAKESRNFRLEWLEIFLEIFQKLALLALLAFALSRSALVRQNLQTRCWTFKSRLILGCVFLGMGCLSAVTDLAQYGKSGWSFLDLQVVLPVIFGLLAGFPSGIFLGALFAFFRFGIGIQEPVYGLMVLCAGIAGDGAALFRNHWKRLKPLSLAAGAAAGAVHGILYYGPAGSWMGTGLWFLSLFFVSALEAAGAFLFYVIVTGALREEERTAAENNHLKTRLLFLQSQMNPHFVFNALNTISALCARENAPEANRLVGRLSDFLRRMLRRSESLVSLEEEMASIDAYLELEKARYQNRLTVVKQIHLTPETWKYEVPALMLQPLVENAVRHGVAPKENGGTVTIEIRESKDEIHVEIADNGAGMSAEKIREVREGRSASREGAGVGLKNILERLAHLYGSQDILSFRSRPGEGTRAILTLPKWKKEDLAKKDAASRPAGG